MESPRDANSDEGSASNDGSGWCGGAAGNGEKVERSPGYRWTESSTGAHDREGRDPHEMSRICQANKVLASRTRTTSTSVILKVNFEPRTLGNSVSGRMTGGGDPRSM